MATPPSLTIWIINHYALPPHEPGSSRHFEFATYLVSKGHKVYIFASDIHYNSYSKLTEIEARRKYKLEEIEGVNFCWIKTIPYSSNNWRRYLNIWSFNRNLRLREKEEEFGKPDLVIGSSFHLFNPWAAMKYCKESKVPFISEIRDLWPETLIQLGTSKLHPLVLLLSYMEKRIYKASDHIILLFPYAHKYIEQLNLGIRKDKMTWIPNGVAVSKFEKAPLPTGKKKYAQANKFNVLNAGSLGNVYILEYLVEAASLLQRDYPDIHIHFVGSGPREKDLKELTAHLKLNNVTFHPPVSKTEIPSLLKEFDLLYASLMESPLYKWGMSLNKLHEYLAAGKPILFASNSKNNPVIESGAGITVKSNSSQEIASAIEYFYHMDDKKRQELGRKGQEYARNFYDFERLGRCLLDCISETIKNHVS